MRLRPVLRFESLLNPATGGERCRPAECGDAQSRDVFEFRLGDSGTIRPPGMGADRSFPPRADRQCQLHESLRFFVERAGVLDGLAELVGGIPHVRLLGGELLHDIGRPVVVDRVVLAEGGWIRKLSPGQVGNHLNEIDSGNQAAQLAVFVQDHYAMHLVFGHRDCDFGDQCLR